MLDTKSILQELRGVPALADLPEEQLTWLATRVEERTFNPNEIMALEGHPADLFFILLDGEIQYRRESDPQDPRVFISTPGTIGGRLPYSRLTHWKGTARAVTAVRVLVGSTTLFPEM